MTDLAQLTEDLRHGTIAAKYQATRELGAYGGAAVEALCAALQDRDGQIRLAAAEALAVLGDPRALGPLSVALKGCFVGRSAKKQLLYALWGLAIFVTAATGCTLVWVFGRGGEVFIGACAVLAVFSSALGVTYQAWRRFHSRICCAIIEAINRIAEREPSLELRAILPDLRAVTTDLVQQEQRTRGAARETAARIERLTESIGSLPLPVGPCDNLAAAESLPRPVNRRP